jgi:AAA+ superfamily predicted ATPase
MNTPDSDESDELLEALKASPENVTLRRATVRALLRAQRLADAESVLREALRRSPDDESWKLSLADVFDREARRSEAWAIYESLTQGDRPSAAALLAFARSLAAAGDDAAAAQHYRRAVAADPAATDPSLERKFGAGRPPESSEGAPPRRSAWRSDDGGDTRDGDEDGGPAPEVERPRVTFADVGGMDAVKEEIRMKILHPVHHPELYRAYGKSSGGGILMYGPPGCGKTHLARATAGEVRAAFISVGISDVLDMWIGQSEQKLHELFESARRSGPCVLFFDEVDAIGASRADMRSSGGRHLINQFLAEMDGIGASNEGVLVLAATNAPWHVDPAFRRPGRFDRVIFVPPPDEPARASILETMLRGKPLGKVDVTRLAKLTKDLSGADLKGVVDRCIEVKLRESMRRGAPSPIATADLERALADVRPSTAEWFATARNYALFANQGGLYDDIRKYLKLS